jgi:NAD+ kinase
MQIAIFGKVFKADQKKDIQFLIQYLENRNIELVIHQRYYEKISKFVRFLSTPKTFTTHTEMRKADFLFSLGGDGTLLETITFVQDTGIPILGINLGRMGFLASVQTQYMKSVLDQVFNRRYKLDKRSLLRLETTNNIFGSLNYALNDISIYRKKPFSMLTVETYVNEQYLNTYWGDGLIIATPTGSTAYSLSCGGPIILPGSQNIVITPIAPHNLTVRPIVIPDDSQIRIKIVGRIRKFFVNIDSRSESVDSSVELYVKTEKFKVNLVQPEGKDFLKTIHEKLNWGADLRN